MRVLEKFGTKKRNLTQPPNRAKDNKMKKETFDFSKALELLKEGKKWAREIGTPTDLRIARQLEVSFCVSREIVKGNGGVPLVGPGFPDDDWRLHEAKEGRR